MPTAREYNGPKLRSALAALHRFSGSSTSMLCSSSVRACRSCGARRGGTESGPRGARLRFAFGASVQSVSADQYSPALSTFVNKTKRLSLISAQDNVFGNPTEAEDPAASAPVFSLQRDLSGYYDCPDTQNDCTQADGSGYFVVPAGVIPAALDTEGQSIHSATAVASVTDAFIGEKWHSAAAFKWLGDAAFGA